MKKAWTDGNWVYTVDSYGANCWRNIWIYRLSDWGKPDAPSWMVTSQNPLYEILNNNAWTTDEAAERALAECAASYNWKEI